MQQRKDISPKISESSLQTEYFESSEKRLFTLATDENTAKTVQQAHDPNSFVVLGEQGNAFRITLASRHEERLKERGLPSSLSILNSGPQAKTMAAVREAYDQSSEKKVICREVFAYSYTLGMPEEMAITAKLMELKLPNIAIPYDYCALFNEDYNDSVSVSETAPDGEKRTYLFFNEYLYQGERIDLANFIEKKPEEALRVFELVCSSVKALHENNIYHRDLKEDNIVMSGDTPDTAEPIIIDLATCTEQKISMDYCGTLEYMLPETRVQEPYSPEASDYLALSVIADHIFIYLNQEKQTPDVKKIAPRFEQYAKDFRTRSYQLQIQAMMPPELFSLRMPYRPLSYQSNVHQYFEASTPNEIGLFQRAPTPIPTPGLIPNFTSSSSSLGEHPPTIALSLSNLDLLPQTRIPIQEEETLDPVHRELNPIPVETSLYKEEEFELSVFPIRQQAFQLINPDRLTLRNELLAELQKRNNQNIGGIPVAYEAISLDLDCVLFGPGLNRQRLLEQQIRYLQNYLAFIDNVPQCQAQRFERFGHDQQMHNYLNDMHRQFIEPNPKDRLRQSRIAVDAFTRDTQGLSAQGSPNRALHLAIDRLQSMRDDPSATQKARLIEQRARMIPVTERVRVNPQNDNIRQLIDELNTSRSNGCLCFYRQPTSSRFFQKALEHQRTQSSVNQPPRELIRS